MEISLLRIFQTVAEKESVSGAAHVLNCVQSNVTTRIRSLEDELDTDLFYRKPRGMVLTPNGRILLDYSKQILHLEKEAKEALQDDGNVRGPLLLGAFESVAGARLPIILSEYHRLYSDVDLSLITGTGKELIKKVVDYKLDGAFVTDEYKAPNISWIEVFREKLVLVYPPGKKSVKDYAKNGVIVFPKPCIYRERLEQWYREESLEFRKKIELGSVNGIIKCVAAGMGVGILPHSLVEEASKMGVISIHRIRKKLESVPIMLIKRKDTVMTQPLKAFLDILLKQPSTLNFK